MGLAVDPAWLAFLMGPLAVLRLLHESSGGPSHPASQGHCHGGVNLTVPGVDTVLDLHGDIVDPDLVVFFNGNQFMMVPELMRAFQSVFPRYQRAYFETLPPGVIEQQVRTGTLTTGNLRVQIQPDVMTCGERRIRRLHETEQWFDDLTPYLRNRLVIMVPKGNPKRVRSWEDLGRDDVRVCMPNPAVEGIGEEILSILRKRGGEGLVAKVMRDKLLAGQTFLTLIHHRQIPLELLGGRSDAGPIWYTEAKLQMDIGNPMEMVEVPQDADGLSTAVAAKFRDAPHVQAAKDFLAFLRSTEAQRIYEKHGFLPLQEQQIAQA